jgi:Ca2+-binding EF-hand superfamily protein
VKVFEEKNYSQAQAQELLPLILAYKSNLLAKAETADRLQRLRLQGNVRGVEVFLQSYVDRILHPELAARQAVQNTVATPLRAAAPLKPEAGSNPQDTVTNIILVNKFLEIPLDGLSTNEITDVTIFWHHLIEGKLLLDFQFSVQIYEFDQNGNWRGTRGATIPAIAVLDVATEQWQVIPCSEVDFLAQNRFYHRTTLWRGQVYTSDGNKVKKFDPLKNAWQELALPDIGNCELFAVNGRLYAANSYLILQILDDSGSNRILASTRRRPPASALDTENLGTPTLFAGPGGTLRAALAAKIYSWDETDWNLVCAAPVTAPRVSLASDGEVLFAGDGWNTDAGIWRLPAGADRVEYCMGQPRGFGNSAYTAKNKPKPKWDYRTEFPLSRLAATVHGTDLYLLAGRTKSENIVDERQHLITGKKLSLLGGCHAELFCYSGNYPTPQKVPLKFDAMDDTVPVGNDADPGSYMPSDKPTSWLAASGDKLFLGREFSDPMQAGNRSAQTKAGIWVAELKPIVDEIERQKQIQAGQLARGSAAKNLTKKALLDQFDWNHDGVIDGAEKEAALTNQYYLAWQLDQIDTNRNGVLDAVELRFFYANTNGFLNTNELAGVEMTQRLLAERLVRKFDDDGNGLLDRREFKNLILACYDEESRSMMGNPFPDGNHDNWIDADELKDFIGKQTDRDFRHSFISIGDNYWHNAGRLPRLNFRGSMPPPPLSQLHTNQ